MSVSAPEKVHLVPDDWHIERVGKLPDGRLIYQEMQVAYDGRESRDFVVSYVFDQDGNLIDDLISFAGVRNDNPAQERQRIDALTAEHRARFGQYQVTDIWVRPFSIERHGLIFGFVPRNLAEDTGASGEDWDTTDVVWRVEAMPGNTLSFYAPWELGGYDT